jgi:hypothetical protein
LLVVSGATSDRADEAPVAIGRGEMLPAAGCVGIHNPPRITATPHEPTARSRLTPSPPFFAERVSHSSRKGQSSTRRVASAAGRSNGSAAGPIYPTPFEGAVRIAVGGRTAGSPLQRSSRASTRCCSSSREGGHAAGPPTPSDPCSASTAPRCRFRTNAATPVSTANTRESTDAGLGPLASRVSQIANRETRGTDPKPPASRARSDHSIVAQPLVTLRPDRRGSGGARSPPRVWPGRSVVG